MSSEETKEIKETDAAQAEEATLEHPEQAMEAVLFAAGYPLSYEKLAQVFEISVLEVKAILYTMKNKYDGDDDRGIQLVFYDDCCQLCTKEGFEKYIRNALGIRQSGKLSNSCMETLAIIAYNQPVTKAVIEQIRGVDCTYAISALSDKNLITVSGKLDVPGKPNLYSTTDDFLRVFGLVGLSELPRPSEESVPDTEPEQITIEGI